MRVVSGVEGYGDYQCHRWFEGLSGYLRVFSCLQ